MKATTVEASESSMEAGMMSLTRLGHFRSGLFGNRKSVRDKLTVSRGCRALCLSWLSLCCEPAAVLTCASAAAEVDSGHEEVKEKPPRTCGAFFYALLKL
jgi:hypothetical protein